MSQEQLRFNQCPKCSSTRTSITIKRYEFTRAYYFLGKFDHKDFYPKTIEEAYTQCEKCAYRENNTEMMA